jgi:hypothetical protein
LGGGCLYLGPVVTVNHAPEIEEPVNDPQETYLIGTVVLNLRVRDEDSEHLTCIWHLDGRPDDPQVCDPDPVRELAFSTYVLEYDPSLDDTFVTATADDPESNKSVTATFHLVLPPGGEP